MITLYIGGKPTDYPTSSESYHEDKVGSVPILVIETVSNKYITFPLGMHCSWRGEKYYLYSPAEVVKVSTREYRYTLTFHGEGQQLALSKFKFIVDKLTDVRLSFALTGKPRFFLEQILRSLPAGFSIGACLEAEAQAVSFKHEDCLSALSRIAEAFKTEWHITGKTIHLGKVVGDKTKSLTLSYGKGKGLLSGLTASNDSEKSPVGKLFIQGAERNIDPSKYGSKSLHLPKGRTMNYEGRTYVVSADGQSLSVRGLSTDGRKEDSFDGTNIYPQRVGVVSSVVVTPKGDYDIIDKDNNVDYSQYRIAGEKATITFQTGRLAGRTFDIAQDKDVLKYDHATKRFQLVSVEEDGLKLPEPNTFYPAVGDKYAVFGVRLPDEYVTKAEEELLNASVRYFHESLHHKVTYKAELDGIYAQKNWGEVGAKLKVGSYVRLVDTNLGVDDYVRITSVRTKISEPYKPQVTLSNEIQAPSLSSSLGTLEADGVQHKEEVQSVRREVARTYQQAMRLADGIADDMRNRFGESISPLTARTMQLMVGDKSLQFVFVASPTATGAVTHNVTWDESRGILHADSGYLRHMTIGITSLSGEHKPSEYKTWALPAYDYAVRTDQKTVHLYAKVERNGAKGMFVASDTAKAMEEEAGYYYLYLGMLSSAPDRVFTPLYGFTEVLPGQVRTERIVSTDGSTSIDLRTGEIVSKKITFVYPDGSQHPYPDSYLHQAIKEGSTEIQGGLVLGSVIGAKDTSGVVTSYLSGLGSLPAFSAGVTNFGKPSEKRVIEINHDGTGHLGAMYIEQGGRVIAFRKEGEDGEASLRIGGGQTPLEDLLRKSTQDESINVQVAGQQVTQTSYEQGIKVVKIASIPIKVLNEGSTIELTVPWNIAIQHTNTDKTKITSKAVLVLKMTDDKGRVAYDFTEYFASGANKGWRIDKLNTPLRHRKAGYSAGSYTLTIEAHISTEIVEGGSYGDAPAKTTFTSQPFTLSYLILGVNASIKESVFGEQGMSIFFGKKRVFYLSKNEKDPFLTIRGLVDSPGVLLAGEVWMRDSQSLRGNPENLHGSLVARYTSQRSKLDAIRYERRSSGHYLVHHNIGHTNYSVQLTPLFADGWNNSAAYTLRVQEKTDNSFVVRCTRWEGGYRGMVEEDYLAFSFLIIGDNY